MTHGQVHGARAYVTQVIQLLNWLSSQNIPLSACSQDLIDAWLDENPARGPRVQGFLVRTSRKGHTRQLAVPLGTPAFTGQLIAQDARWSLVSRLIHDEEIPIVDKTAGLLALLFAQQPHRIAELTTDDVHLTADAVALRLGSIPAQMPPPLDELLLALHADAVAGSTAAERWLFPGRYPGRPLSRSQVMRRLHALGIRPRMARSTALVELASELPAQLRYCVDTVGVDRIIHAVDFPMIGNEGAVPFLADSDLSDEDKDKIAHGNADKLLGLDRIQ
ncbi:amidohydrolase family protein [Streptomyces sp. NBC_00104]|uniref:amidohydrolase family protein n=1 Tax=unclassified Streptomyces TaxID=2593676 RepID=UPI003247E161